MIKSKCFLHNPGVISNILQETLNGGIEEATVRGAICGAIAAAILVDGELHMDVRALGCDVATENDPNKTWEDDPNIGINYAGYAMGKIAQSIRTGTYSKEGRALGYGESDSAGSYNEICFCRDINGEEVKFQLLAAYSGMTSEEDFYIAHAASRRGWLEMSGQKNYDGSDIRLCRIVSGCCC